jgi:arylsulfatase A-like enzyme
MKCPLVQSAAAFLGFVAIVAAQAGGDTKAAAGRPNIVILLADDLGYGDVGCYGGKAVPTPHIDSIAASGVRFTDGYVTAPICSPSRAGLLTGRYQQRFGFEFNVGPAQRDLKQGLGLPLNQTTLADVFKKAGYATGMVGKWHLGSQPQFNPLRRGFDHFFGFLPGEDFYIDPRQQGVTSVAASDGEDKLANPHPLYRDGTPVRETSYLTDAFAREATSFLARNRNRPFFLYVPFNAVHTPLQATARYMERVSGIDDSKHRVYAAMTSALDDAVGAVLKKLRDLDLEKNTLLVFLSDNGGATYIGAGSNTPLNGTKLTVLEGGIRIPFMMRWPGHLSAGSVYQDPISSLDLFPTTLGAAGISVPGNVRLDGVNLLPYLEGKKPGSPHEMLFWRVGENAAMRKGQWKLVQAGTNAWLFDLAQDIGEGKDLARDHPDVVADLKKALAAWNAQLKPPLWPSRKAVPIQFHGVTVHLSI